MSPKEAACIARVAVSFRRPWLLGYAHGKLRLDPVYRAVFERIGDSDLPLLDVGCGMGLLAFYLRERGYAAPVLGLDVDAGKVARGEEIAERHYPGVTLQVGEGSALPAFAGHVCLLDVLHYFSPEAQSALLRDLASRVAPRGWCLLRLTPRDAGWRFRATQLEEHFVRLIAWMQRPALAYPTLTSVTAHFPEAEWEHEVRPLWGCTPFNSWLLAFRRR